MAETLLLIDRDENRRLLVEWLSTRHEVVTSIDGDDPERSPDLYIVDRVSLERHAGQLAERKTAAEPVFLPYLLVVSQQYLGQLSSEIWEQIDAVVQKGVDELITAPVKKTELHGRRSSESLLRTRRLSLDLRDRNDELRTLNHVNAVIRTVNGALVTAVTREEIEREVCEQLASAPPYRFAWIGEPAVTGTTVEPRTTAGVESGYLDAPIPIEEGAEPTGDALAAGEPRFVRPADGTWAEAARKREYRAVAAIPLIYGETVYGVLGVYSGRSEAFDAQERAVLSELGRTIGHAINAAESKKALVADTVTELRFEFARTPPALIELSRSGAEVSLEGAVSNDAGDLLKFYAIDRLPEDALDRLSAAPDVETVRVVADRNGEVLVELRFRESLLAGLGDQGDDRRWSRATARVASWRHFPGRSRSRR